MDIQNLRTENDILLYIGSKIKEFKSIINYIFGTKDINIYGTEYELPHRYRTTCGKRVDIMFFNSNMYIPIELKRIGNESGYNQLKEYIEILKTSSNKEINGVLICIKATKQLKQKKLDNNISIIELSTGRAW